MTTHTPQDSQSELEDILRARVKVIGDNEWTVLGYPDELIKAIEAYVTTRVAKATSKPLPRELKLVAKVANLDQKIVMLEAYVTTRVKEAERLARLDFKQTVINADNTYTNEQDRKLWNHFKQTILGEGNE